MAKESTFKNMVLVLGLVCLVCSALLSLVYVVTKEPIQDALVAKTNGAISNVLPEFDNVPSEEKSIIDLAGKGFTVYTAKKGENVIGYAIESSEVGFGGEVKLMVGFDALSGTIFNVDVISQTETPGLGAKIADNGEGNFREQFKGFNPSIQTLKVTKEGGDVDAITASTITSKAFVSAVDKAYQVYKLLIENNSTVGEDK